MDLSSSPNGSVAGPSKGVNNLLRTLHGEHFRRGLNADRVRIAHSTAQQERGPSLPPLVPTDPTLPRFVPSHSFFPKRPAPGPPSPRSWMQHADELAMRESFAFERDSAEWRAYALRLAYAHLAAPPPTPSLVGLCLQRILNEGSDVYLDILPELPVHLRRHLMLETAIADPLPSDGIRALLGSGAATSVGGELVLTKPYGALFLQRLGTLAPRTEEDETAPDRDWDDDAKNWDNDEDGDAAPLHTLILLNTTLAPALIPLFPSTLTRIALVALITPLPGLHCLPARTPLLVFLDLSFNPWLTDLVGGDVEDEGTVRMVDRIVWERWRRLEVLGLRECGFDDATTGEVVEKIQRCRIQDVQIYLCYGL